MAENSQGSALSRARLTVVMSEDRPSAPYNVHAETMSSSAILLAWERPLYNSDKVIAYSVHYMKAEGRCRGSLFSTPFASMDIAQLVKRLPGMHEAPTLIPRTPKPDVVAHACDPNTWEVESGKSEVQGHPQLIANLRPTWAI